MFAFGKQSLSYLNCFKFSLFYVVAEFYPIRCGHLLISSFTSLPFFVEIIKYVYRFPENELTYHSWNKSYKRQNIEIGFYRRGNPDEQQT